MSLNGFGNGPNTGIQGQPGPRGRSIFTLDRAPQPTDGEPGDYAYDKVSQRFYGPKLQNVGWNLDDYTQLGFASADAATQEALSAAADAVEAGLAATAATAQAQSKITETETARLATVAATSSANTAAGTANAAAAAASAVVAAGASILAAKDETIEAKDTTVALAALFSAYKSTSADKQALLFLGDDVSFPFFEELDGSINIDILRVWSGAIRALMTGKITFENATGVVAGTLGFSLAKDAMLYIGNSVSTPLYVSPVGAVEIDLLESLHGNIRKLSSGSVELKTGLGMLAGKLKAEYANGARFSVNDPSGIASLQLDENGALDAVFDKVLPYVGAKQASGNGYLIEARRRAPSYVNHDLWSVNTMTGAEAQLTSDTTDTVDFLNPTPVGNFCTYIARRGRRLSPAATKLDGGVATGNITFALNPVAGSTVTLNGTEITFVSSGATTNQVNIGATLAETISNLVFVLKTSLDPNLAKASYVATPTKLMITSRQYGVVGNKFTLAASVATVSGATLSGAGKVVPVHSRMEWHMLGDSFLGTAGPGESIPAYVAQLLNRPVTVDGVGGSYLLEQYYRLGGGTVPPGPWNSAGVTYPGTPEKLDAGLWIMDGGLSDADPITQIGNIVSLLTPAMPRWLYIQSGYQRNWSPATVAAKQATDAAIQAAFPNNFVPTYDYIRSVVSGSTIGSGGGEVYPADFYEDDIHPTVAGKKAIAACGVSFILSKGWN